MRKPWNSLPVFDQTMYIVRSTEDEWWAKLQRVQATTNLLGFMGVGSYSFGFHFHLVSDVIMNMNIAPFHVSTHIFINM